MSIFNVGRLFARPWSPASVVAPIPATVHMPCYFFCCELGEAALPSPGRLSSKVLRFRVEQSRAIDSVVRLRRVYYPYDVRSRSRKTRFAFLRKKKEKEKNVGFDGEI